MVNLSALSKKRCFSSVLYNWKIKKILLHIYNEFVIIRYAGIKRPYAARRFKIKIYALRNWGGHPKLFTRLWYVGAPNWHTFGVWSDDFIMGKHVKKRFKAADLQNILENH